MTWLLSASEFENDDVFENSDSRVPPLALQDLDQRRGERVDVLRVQALDNGFQSAEQQVEVQRGRRAVHGYLRAGRQDLRRSGAVDEFEVAIADQVEIANLRLGAGGQHDVAVRVELDEHLAVRLQRHLLDGADPDARDPHGVPGFEP